METVCEFEKTENCKNKNKMKKIPTVTIAVCAYNEGLNIGQFLDSILLQKEDGYIIESIVVISDGSTDKTVQIVQKKHTPKLNLAVHKFREGKSKRLNELYKSLSADLLIQSDADVIFSHEFVVRDIVLALQTGKTMMCGGNPEPLPARTFTEKAVNHSTLPYRNFRRTVRQGNNVFSADGRLLGFRKEFIKTVKIPETMIANDMYAYFCCREKGLKYKYVPSAVVWYRSPQSVRDHIRQNTRFVAAPIRMNRYFSPELVKKETYIPPNQRLINFGFYFLKNPVLSSYIVLLNIYCKMKAFLTEKHLKATWKIAFSTKGLTYQ